MIVPGGPSRAAQSDQRDRQAPIDMLSWKGGISWDGFLAPLNALAGPKTKRQGAGKRASASGMEGNVDMEGRCSRSLPFSCVCHFAGPRALMPLRKLGSSIRQPSAMDGRAIRASSAPGSHSRIANAPIPHASISIPWVRAHRPPERRANNAAGSRPGVGVPHAKVWVAR